MGSKRIRAFVDRIEGDYAVLLLGDEGLQVPWPLSELPDGVNEGMVLRIEIRLDSAATKAAEDTINELIDRLERGE